LFVNEHPRAKQRFAYPPRPLSDNRVGFDVFAGTVFVACTTLLPTGGSFACDMVFRASDPTVAIEIRIQLLAGAIEGQLRLLGAKLRRLPEPPE
jgi:hypothetical protein